MKREVELIIENRSRPVYPVAGDVTEAELEYGETELKPLHNILMVAHREYLPDVTTESYQYVCEEILPLLSDLMTDCMPTVRRLSGARRRGCCIMLSGV